jgi:hypothetical protein
MRWRGGLEWKYKRHNWTQWHKWFAWHPVVVGTTKEGYRQWVWLEQVERHADFYVDGYDWKYREVNNG